MLKHIYLILTATFIFGFISGCVLFLQSHTGENAIDFFPEQKIDQGYSISAYMYGGCERIGCPSYQVREGGAFTYLAKTGVDTEHKKEGKLSNLDEGALVDALGAINFEAVPKKGSDAVCAADADGISFRYDIEYEGNRYRIDSCKHVLTDPLFEILMEYFTMFTK